MHTMTQTQAQHEKITTAHDLQRGTCISPDMTERFCVSVIS